MRVFSSQLATATVAPLKYKLNVNTLEHMAATKLELNEIGVITNLVGGGFGGKTTRVPFVAGPAAVGAWKYTRVDVVPGADHFLVGRTDRVVELAVELIDGFLS